jgi:aspartate/methionine/tyrosine aminotransferase
MQYRRMVMEVESPEELGYAAIRYNLAESSIRELTLAQLDLHLDDLAPVYGNHAGDPALRALIAERTPGIDAADVIVTAGAAMALFIVATVMLDRGDHLVVERPNYASNLETPRMIGCAIDYVDLQFEDAYRLDIERVSAALRPRTRLVSLTSPHNPTGSQLTPAELTALVEIVERSDARLLVDETYHDLARGVQPVPLAAALSARAISVSSVSKAYGLPGIRVGWIACRDPELRERFLAAKEQICLTGSILDEGAARRALEEGPRWLGRASERVETGIRIVREWVARESAIEWIEPSGGAVCFPRVRRELRPVMGRFYGVLREHFATIVGPGHWFEQPEHCMRIGFGWPEPDELEAGLTAISAALEETAS